MSRLIIRNLKELYRVAEYISKDKNIKFQQIKIHDNLTDSQIEVINRKLCNFIKLPHLHYLSYRNNLNQFSKGK